MQIKEFLEKVCYEIKYKPIQKEIAEELKNHIEEIKQEQIKKGIEENKAEEIAVKQMGEPIEIGKKLNKIHKPRLDWSLILLVISLIAFGILVSFIKTQMILTDGNEINYFLKTIIYLGIGVSLGIGIYFFDYRKLTKYSNYIYAVATIITILGLTVMCGYINGKAYLKIFNISISIESVAIPLYIIAFAGFINKYDKNNIFEFCEIIINKDFTKILTLSIISILLLMYIPSLSSCIILSLIYIILTTIGIIKKSEKKKKYLIILYSIISVLVIVSIFEIFIVHPYRLDRITAYIHPEKQADGAGWIPLQQRLILNSAKPIGEAEDLSNGLNIFDEGTDYALVSIIAHYGIIPAIAIIAIILIFSTKILYNSKVIKDNYGKFLIIGLGGYFIIESLINVLMNFTIGIQISSKIPFVSYGGASLVIDIICIALILAIYRRKDIIRQW